MKTRLEAMDTAEKNSPQVQSDIMDTSFSVLGKRARSCSVSHILEIPTQVSVGKRVRGEPEASSLAVVRTHAPWWSSDLAHDGKMREMEAWKFFKVLSPIQESDISKKAIDSRWVLNWMMVDDVMQVKARLVTKGFQATDLTEGLVVSSGCVSLWSSHILVVSLCALNKWMFWSLDIMDALLQAEGFDRVVFRLLWPNGIRR